ncbi:MAG: hypothetical protein K2Y37_22300 [Pirellulales bacterium]|nr:hypothetical protein [Pirellulales bacterium]
MRFSAPAILCLGAMLLASIGCSRGDPRPPAPAISLQQEIDGLVKGLEAPSALGRVYSLRRLKELGGEAKSAIPALKKFARANPQLKAETEQTIAHIESGAPPKNVASSGK